MWVYKCIEVREMKYFLKCRKYRKKYVSKKLHLSKFTYMYANHASFIEKDNSSFFHFFFVFYQFLKLTHSVLYFAFYYRRCQKWIVYEWIKLWYPHYCMMYIIGIFVNKFHNKIVTLSNHESNWKVSQSIKGQSKIKI